MSDEKIEVVAYGTDDGLTSGADAKVFADHDEAVELVKELEKRDDVTGFARKTVFLDEILDDDAED
ncbi:hypothetical protein [Haloarcula quadrata]|nr:hypothetical protein [Haloarcula quadrata]